MIDQREGTAADDEHVRQRAGRCLRSLGLVANDMVVNGASVIPTDVPTAGFLNSYNDLFAGIYAASPGGELFTISVDSFQVSVVPEPGMMPIGAGISLAAAAVWRRRRRKNASSPANA